MSPEYLAISKQQKKELTTLLSRQYEKPAKGMDTFPLGKFSALLTQFGTSELRALPGNLKYEALIQKGMLLGYKELRVYNGQAYGYHWGIDILSPAGTPVYAADNGKIIRVCCISDLTEEFGGETFGNYIVAENQHHAMPIYTLYGHLAHLGKSIVRGQRIAKGQQLGVMGNEFTVENGGWPPHLHLQIALSPDGLWAYGDLELEELTLNPEEVFEIMKK